MVRPEKMLAGSVVKPFDCALQELLKPRYLRGRRMRCAAAKER